MIRRIELLEVRVAMPKADVTVAAEEARKNNIKRYFGDLVILYVNDKVILYDEKLSMCFLCIRSVFQY